MLTSTALAVEDGSIMFCNEKQRGGPCITEKVVYDECVPIPDSNAKGDEGSSFDVRSAPLFISPFISF